MSSNGIRTVDLINEYDISSSFLLLRTESGVCIDTQAIETKSMEVLADVAGYE